MLAAAVVEIAYGMALAGTFSGYCVSVRLQLATDGAHEGR